MNVKPKRTKKGRTQLKAGDAPAPSLDDAATILVQLEPGDVRGFERLKQVLASLQDPALRRKAAALVSEAIAQIDLLLRGEATDGEDVMIEVSRILEAAANAMEEPEATEAAGAGTEGAAAAESVPSHEVEEPAAASSRPRNGEPVSTPPTPAPAASEEGGLDWLPPDSDKDLLTEFITESQELLEGAESAMLTLESDPADADAVNRVFRAFHTIKGTSAFLGLARTSALAHHAETLLSRIRNGEIRFAGGYADLSLRAVDMLKVLIRSVADGLSGGPMPVPEGYEELTALLSAPEAAGICEESADATWVLDGGDEPGDAAPGFPGNPPPVEPESAEARGATQLGGAPAQASRTRQQATRGDSRVDSSVRVSTTRLDRLIDMVGELVIAQSMVAQDRTLLEEACHDLMRKVTHAGKIVRELQDLSMSMRMVPLKATFQKMHRLVRDLSHKSGKNIALEAEDRDTEIDRHMVDIINDLLVHMVRNAVDHGIESPDVRVASGKPPAGKVSLTAFHSGGSVVVEVRDDGRGLDRERILRKAVASGLVDGDKGMSDGEVYNLIFAPGFSTADTVTDISGRGVGMDVVRKGVEALHGRIDISTEPGNGSSFSVRLPLTLAITDGMLVKVGADRYIVPTVNIHLCFRPRQDQLSTIAARGEMVLLRGELMPIFRLHRLFETAGAIHDPTAGLLVVVGDGERRCALLVDELLGQQQFVAKSLGEGVGKVQGVSGAAILGDGRVGLILDPAEIAALARQDSVGWESFGRPAA